MKKAKAKDFDAAFDYGEDVTQSLDKSKARRVNAELESEQRIDKSFHLLVWGGLWDLNPRPSEPQSDALTN